MCILKKLLLLLMVVSFPYHVWADDPDYSGGVLVLPTVTVEKTIIFNNVELAIDLNKGAVDLKRAEPDNVVYARALLNAGQQVPALTSSGSGWGIVAVNRTTGDIRGTIWIEGLSGVTMAHIHTGKIGENGPIIINFEGDENIRTISDGMKLTPEQLKMFFEGGLYFNVHTTANPGGELRGQIQPRVIKRIVTKLTSNQEVPATISPATGVGIVTVNLATRAISGQITLQGMSGSTAAHIHQGAKGENGDVLVPLVGNDTLYKIPEGTVLTPQQLTMLLKGNLYLNVHTIVNPKGDIRGQLVPYLE